MPRNCKLRDWHGITTPYSPLCGLDVAPPANSALLREADDIQIAVGMTYAQTAIMTECNTATAGTTRRFLAVIPPGRNHAYLAVTRCAAGQFAAQVDHTAGSDSSGFGAVLGVPTPALDPVKGNSTAMGTEVYLDMTTNGIAMQLGFAKACVTDDKVNDVLIPPAAPGTLDVTMGSLYRALKVAEDRVSTLEWIQASHHAGVGLIVHGVTTDLELLP